MFWASGRKTLPPRMGHHGHHGHHDQKAVRPRVKPVSLNPNWLRVFWAQSLGSGPGPRVTRLSSRTSPGRPGRVPEGLNPGRGGRHLDARAFVQILSVFLRRVRAPVSPAAHSAANHPNLGGTVVPAPGIRGPGCQGLPAGRQPGRRCHLEGPPELDLILGSPWTLVGFDSSSAGSPVAIPRPLCLCRGSSGAAVGGVPGRAGEGGKDGEGQTDAGPRDREGQREGHSRQQK